MKHVFRTAMLALMVVVSIPALLNAEEGDFFFAPEIGWSHLTSSTQKEGIFAGAHFGYDTSNFLAIELLMIYGDNNGDSGNPDARYVVGGGGISYKYRMGKFKPSLFAGAGVVALDFTAQEAAFKGGLYLGGAFEYSINKVISIGVTYKYAPVFRAPNLSLLGFRLGFEL